ncbi:ATP-binding protein [Leeia sp.]|uniref:ATP-binding protein n=1 Tax=Leeia sp. TaxID=2884678 RepID=UPI0035B2C242
MSIQRRLLLSALLATLLVWGLAVLAAWSQARREADELFDAEQIQFAHQLLDAYARLPVSQIQPAPQAGSAQRQHGKEHDGLGFALWNAQQQLILSDGQDGAFPFPAHEGFRNVTLHGEQWRLYTARDQRSGLRVTVAQEHEFRLEVAGELTGSMQLAWLLALPLLLLALIWAIRTGLRPLRDLTLLLQRRQPEDTAPLPDDAPQEVQPLVQALNQLLNRYQDLLDRERRFIGDAAHELKTPLAALRVQAEVASLAQEPAVQLRALQQLVRGVVRSERLLQQLLLLSQLDPMSQVPDAQAIYWPELLETMLEDWGLTHPADDFPIQVIWSDAQPLPLQGNAMLLSLLLRNLLENARLYAASEAGVRLTLAKDGLTVSDHGPGMTAEHLARLGERFYRPAGQAQHGSGLGVSIAMRIAQLHGLQLDFHNRPEGGLEVRLHRSAAA